MSIQRKFSGISDELLRFIEEKQLKDRSVWKLIVKQFAIGNVDDEDFGWRGEYWGKLMRGACMTYQYTKDEELYEILTNAAIDLIAAQDEEGRIATYSKTGEFQGWDMWSRKYVLLGLIHYHEICREHELKEKVLSAACRHLDYVIAHVGEEEGKISITQTSPVWRGINSSSILEPVVRLYALTENKSYLDFASYIVNHGGAEGFNMFEAAYEDKLYPYQYPVVKAYELMSCFEGLIWYYKVTGIEKWRVASENFVKRLIESEATIVGGSGCEHELFNHSSLKQTYGGYQGLMLETCVTVTWMKLLYAMYELTGCSLYLDEIECSAFNALYGAVNTEEAVCGPETTFDLKHYRGVYDCYIADKGNKGQVFDSYSPLMAGIRGRAVGGFKAMENRTAFSGCCIVIGAAGVALVPQAAVHTTQNGLAVGLYLSGNIVLEAVGTNKTTVKMAVNTAYPADGKVEIILQEVSKAGENFEIALRIPAFAKGSTVQVNDGSVSEAMAGDFVRLSREWQTGDKIVLNLAMNPRLVFGMHNPEDTESEKRVAVLYGPLALARDKRLSEVGKPVVLTERKLTLKPYPDKAAFPYQCAFMVQIDGNEIPMVDYASAGKTWRRDSEMEVWMDSLG